MFEGSLHPPSMREAPVRSTSLFVHHAGEFMGEVVDVGADNRKLKVGDRAVVPFTICCGECEQCRRGNYTVGLEDGPDMYRTFRDKKDGCIKVVLKP